MIKLAAKCILSWEKAGRKLGKSWEKEVESIFRPVAGSRKQVTYGDAR
jgi:hypothetical protein